MTTPARQKKQSREGQREVQRQRVKKAVEMAMAGATYEQIAKECGWSNRSTAHRLVARAMKDMPTISPEDLAGLREQELARLDRLQAAHWVRALQGDKGSTDVVLRIMDRRAKITGLDAPTKVEGTFQGEVDKEIAALVAQLPNVTKG